MHGFLYAKKKKVKEPLLLGCWGVGFRADHLRLADIYQSLKRTEIGPAILQAPVQGGGGY